MNILITAAATAQAYQLQRCFNNEETIFLADSADLPQVMLKDKKFIKIPSADSPAFAHLLLTLCLDMQIEKVYPLRKSEILALAEAKQLFDEYGIKLMVPDRTDIPNLLNKGVKGAIIIKENSEPDDFPGRGIFIKDEMSCDFQLFTVD